MMHDHDDRWDEFRTRREEWRAQRHARREPRRQAWRAQREAQREQWAKVCCSWGMDPADWCLEGSTTSETAELKAQVESMKKTIEQLGERIVVLEKLAVSSDDARLAAEIEKLRRTDTDDHG
jgi:hypothetical protein